MNGADTASGPGGTGPRLGFVGLGTMGGPMCRRLAAGGYQVTAYDLDAVAVAAAVEAGAVAAGSASDCARGADLFMTALPGPPQVEAVMAGRGGALGEMSPGSVWVDLSTSSRELVLELAGAAPGGVAVVDSPVTGAVDGARQGELTLFAGGEPEVVASVRPILEHLGTVIECGPLGSGNVVKLVTNQLWFAAAAALGEGFAVGLANGVELDTLWRAILDSVGDSFVARHDAPSIFAGHYDPSFPLALCVKDLGLLADLESNVDADLPVTSAARHAFERAAQRYGLDAGEMSVARRIEDDAGMSMRLEGDWTPHWEK
ncbi:MAG: NAD(P)-dependent oxidoreductase [Acidimicrobiaceae bacterium]|nr:NAD(P)-dependent oxidoreductase [Acidimicrobiaceae bacterium]MYL04779.1 NAD(P)-dependent oxidoreductase [Acidimicrobiaceae bacterium]